MNTSEHDDSDWMYEEYDDDWADSEEDEEIKRTLYGDCDESEFV